MPQVASVTRLPLLPYLGFIRTSCLTMLAYRLRYYTGILNYMAFVSVNYFIWLAVFANQPAGSTIKGFTLPEMVTYVTIGWIARTVYFSNIHYDINEMVRTGEVTVHLMRPVSFQLMTLANAIGEWVFRVFFLSLPVGLGLVLIFPVAPPASLVDFGWFCWSTMISFLVLSQVHFIVGLTAFYLHSINGIIRATFYLVQLFSGLLLPIPFFPGWFRTLVEFLPFQLIAFTPLQFYLGKIPKSEWASVVFSQIAWTVVLFIIGHLIWSRARSKVETQGG